MTVLEIQQALKQAGFELGSIDGIRGRRTIQAIKAFQQHNGLVPDGLVGPLTSAKLFQSLAKSRAEAIPSTLPWLEEATRLIGTIEKRGPGSNQVILDWAESLDINDYSDDDIPWCGLFTAHSIESQLSSEPIPNNFLSARSWSKFGKKVAPTFGAIMVFWRDRKDGWKGHVGFYWAEDETHYHILGGNQNNSVSITRVSKKRLLSARWPSTALNVEPYIRIASSEGVIVTENEA